MIGKRNQARRKAESQALFHTMLKAGKTNIVTPAKFAGTRTDKNNKAIKESRDN